jgi:FkbM family methyltransferase
MHLLSALLHPGDIVWDVGAHHGYVTLSASRKVGSAGSVQSFEPSMMNRGALNRHVAWNRLENVTVHPFALSNFDGETNFGGTGTSKMFALGGGAEVVQVRSGMTMVQRDSLPLPTFIKIDVEGAEGDTVAGLIPVLPRNARLFIAMHSAAADAQCQQLLSRAGWECVASKPLQRCRGGEWVSDPDMFCMGPDYAGRDADRATLRRADF